MSIEDRWKYIEACALVRRHGMELITKEMLARVEAMETVVSAVEDYTKSAHFSVALLDKFGPALELQQTLSNLKKVIE